MAGPRHPRRREPLFRSSPRPPPRWRFRTRIAAALAGQIGESLLVGGEAGPYLEDRLLGLELELLAEKHPARLGPGRVLPVRILYQDRPLAHHPVRAMWEEDPGVSLDVRTDEDGRARFELPRAGVWMVRAVHMVEAEEGLDFDWESFWASLTFEIPEPSRH